MSTKLPVRAINVVRAHACANPSRRWGRVRRMSDERLASIIGGRRNPANVLKAVRAALRNIGA